MRYNAHVKRGYTAGGDFPNTDKLFEHINRKEAIY